MYDVVAALSVGAMILLPVVVAMVVICFAVGKRGEKNLEQ